MHDAARVAEVAAVEVLVEELLHVGRLVASVELGVHALRMHADALRMHADA